MVFLGWLLAIAVAIVAVGAFVVWWGRRSGTTDTDASAADPAAASVPSPALSD